VLGVASGTSFTIGANTLDATEFAILDGITANKTVDHTSVSIINGNGITGGGDLSANRTLALTTLTSDWDIGDGRMIQADKIRARDGDGLALYEDGGAGIFIKDGGNVGIGTVVTAGAKFNVVMENPSSSYDCGRFVSYSDNTRSPLVRYQKARGTIALPAGVQNGDVVGEILGQGYSATFGGFVNAGDISIEIDGTPDSGGDTTDMPGRIVFYTTPDGSSSLAERMRITSAGYVGIGTTAPLAKLVINGGVHVGGDSDPLDNNLMVDGKVLVPEIKTDTATPTDLTITTGAAKTLVLATPVYKDINIAGILLGKPASNAPGIDTFRDLNGTDTTINAYAFAIGEYVSGGFELQHDYKEATDVVFHVHWQGIAAPAGGTDNVQWRLTYIIARDGVTLAAATTIDSPDVAITTQYRNYRSDFAAIVGTNLKIGDQFMFNLYRVAAVSDDYAGDCLIHTAGIHHQCDTLGSRAIATK
jgi:hypothetical protein